MPTERKKGNQDLDLESMEVRLANSIANLKDDLSKQIKDAAKEMRSDIKSISESQNDLSVKFDVLQQDLAMLKKSNEALQSENNDLRAAYVALQDKCAQNDMYLDDLDQYMRRDSLVISGIPTASDESTNSIIIKLAGLLGIVIQQEDISVSHRLQQRRDNVTPNIIVKFTRRVIRDKLFNQRKKAIACVNIEDFGFATSTRKVPIYINESLTPNRSKLHKLCVEFKKENSFKFCWTKYGQIYLRKNELSDVIKIRTQNDLDNLKQIIS